MSPVTAAQLVALVRRRAEGAPGPLVVALDGRSGAGKSTLARSLGVQLGAAVVEGDDFYAGGVQLRDDDIAARAAACIDWRRQREVLGTLRAARPARYHAFDWDAFDGSLRAEATLVEPAPVVILEGVYSARPELAGCVDLRVLVSVDDAERLRRLHAREGGIGAWEQQWLDAEGWYLAPERAPAFDAVVFSRNVATASAAARPARPAR